MKYLYLLQSQIAPEEDYVGATRDLPRRCNRALSGAERRHNCLDFPLAGVDNYDVTGLVADEERLLTPPANSVGSRFRLQLAPRFAANVNANHFTTADTSTGMMTLANPMC